MEDNYDILILNRSKKGECLLCGIPVKWDSTDIRADDSGSFVDPNGHFECPSGRLHQG